MDWTSFNWFDWLLVVVFLYGGVQGFMYGFVQTFVSLAGSALALAGGIFYGDEAAAFLDSSVGLADRVREAVERYIDVPEVFQSIPADQLPVEQIAATMEEWPIPPAVRDALMQAINDLVTPAAAATGDMTVAQVVWDALTQFMVATIGFIAAYFAVLILVRLIGRLMALGRTNPVGGLMDRAAGLVLGVAQYAIWVVLFLLVAVPLTSMPLLQSLAGPVSSSVIATRLLDTVYLATPWLLDVGGQVVAP